MFQEKQRMSSEDWKYLVKRFDEATRELGDVKRQLAIIKALWNNGTWGQDEAYDSVYQFKEWDANTIMKHLGFTVVTKRREE